MLIRESLPLVRGDLDWIVMKCLEKDRARRYETAAGLSSDVQRHLDNEPVSAGPPSHLHKLRKLVLRNRVLLTTVSAVEPPTLIMGNLHQGGEFQTPNAKTRIRG